MSRINRPPMSISRISKFMKVNCTHTIKRNIFLGLLQSLSSRVFSDYPRQNASSGLRLYSNFELLLLRNKLDRGAPAGF